MNFIVGSASSMSMGLFFKKKKKKIDNHRREQGVPPRQLATAHLPCLWTMLLSHSNFFINILFTFFLKDEIIIVTFVLLN